MDIRRAKGRGKKQTPDLIGLVPAAGRASRLLRLPCSKEVFPVEFGPRCKVACEFLLERMRETAVRNVYVVLREGKWDIPAYLGDGSSAGLNLAYLMMGVPYGVPYTLDQAYPFVRHAQVVFGFPDILFDPKDAFVQLLNHQTVTGADVVLGIFPAHQPNQADLVETDKLGRARRIVVKPRVTQLRDAWIMAVWTSVFTQFLHEHLVRIETSGVDTAAGTTLRPERAELHLGHVFQVGIEAGLHVETVPFKDGRYLDIGTLGNLVSAVKAHLRPSE